MKDMFYRMEGLKTLDIRKFIFTKVSSYSGMFDGHWLQGGKVPASVAIYVKDQAFYKTYLSCWLR